MKTLAELEAIRQKTLDSVNLRREHEGTRVVVGMAMTAWQPSRFAASATPWAWLPAEAQITPFFSWSAERLAILL